MVLLSILIYQGIVQKPKIAMFWSTKSLFETPYILKIMTEQRFSLLKKCLHFVDNNTVPISTSSAERSFWNIKNFFHAVIERFSSVYIPNAYVAVDA